MSRLEANKQLVRSFIEALAKLDGERFLSFLAEDVRFETTGHHEASGVKTKAEVAKEFPAMREVLPSGLRLNELSITAEDDRVAIELRGQARTVKGEEYNNHYFYFIQIREGKIITFRDYMDSTLVVKMLLPSFHAHGATAAGRAREK